MEETSPSKPAAEPVNVVMPRAVYAAFLALLRTAADTAKRADADNLAKLRQAVQGVRGEADRAELAAVRARKAAAEKKPDGGVIVAPFDQGVAEQAAAKVGLTPPADSAPDGGAPVAEAVAA